MSAFRPVGKVSIENGRRYVVNRDGIIFTALAYGREWKVILPEGGPQMPSYAFLRIRNSDRIFLLGIHHER